MYGGVKTAFQMASKLQLHLRKIPIKLFNMKQEQKDNDEIEDEDNNDEIVINNIIIDFLIGAVILFLMFVVYPFFAE